MNRLAGKTAIVTGGASGIGRAQVVKLIEEGANVVAFDMNAEGLEELAKADDVVPDRLVTFAGSIAKKEDVEACVKLGIETFKGIDILCNTAGIFDNYALSLDIPESKWDLYFDVNVKGPWLMTNATLPHMIAQKNGAIVNMCSLAGLTAGPGGAAYVPTKFAMVGMTKELAVQYGADGVRVNGIAPGTVMTPLVQQAIDSDPTWLDARLEQVPIKRLGQANDIANLTVFLASEESSWITGEVISIDGGRNALG